VAGGTSFRNQGQLLLVGDRMDVPQTFQSRHEVYRSVPCQPTLLLLLGSVPAGAPNVRHRRWICSNGQPQPRGQAAVFPRRPFIAAFIAAFAAVEACFLRCWPNPIVLASSKRVLA
jgi:hypothetical protein